MSRCCDGDAGPFCCVGQQRYWLYSEKQSDMATDADAAYRLLGQPGRWWSREHSDSGDAANLSLEQQAGGCFCEKISGSDGR